MPRKDPMTGVTVITTGEMFNKLAESEGKGRTGADLWEEQMEAMEREYKREYRRYNTKKFLLGHLNELIDEWNDGVEPDEKIKKLRKIVEIKESNPNSTFKSYKYKGHVVAVNDDGERGELHAECYEFSGSYWDPPDSDMEMWWEGEKK